MEITVSNTEMGGSKKKIKDILSFLLHNESRTNPTRKSTPQEDHSRKAYR
jgi:hypothetical protein